MPPEAAPSPSQGEGWDGGGEVQDMTDVTLPHYRIAAPPQPSPPPERGEGIILC
jgi:hypothetical protein